MVCLTSVIVESWPTIMSFVAGAVAMLGLTAVKIGEEDKQSEGSKTQEVDLEVGSVQGDLIGDKQMFIKEGVIYSIKFNEKGRLILNAKSRASSRQSHIDFFGGFWGN